MGKVRLRSDDRENQVVVVWAPMMIGTTPAFEAAAGATVEYGPKSAK